ncbi:uncharacterized protein LOC114363986 [Ostrinia furnacalis]|uniref:uncharacterized protein LOC114363986 n=1 Tax=Ostrinia furnacalis TaxID=93504 RepID=UPI00103E538A|nr:uncharacterized protein LOC114363986 [Ostrinia furnacalis]
MKEFKYDVKTLIQGVRDRPCLWNKSLEVYKDRLERRNAWEEIFNLMDESYEMLPPEEKRLTGEHIVNKWTNIRDTFVKSLRAKMGKSKRRYIYYDLLKFLISEIRGEDHEEEEFVEEVNVPYMKEENPSEGEIEPRKRSKRLEKSDDSCTPVQETSFKEHITRKRSKKKETAEQTKVYESSNDIDFVEVEDSDPRLMNEDEAFFASLLPTVVKYNEDERLEFRIEVLNVMKKLKENRRWSNGDP